MSNYKMPSEAERNFVHPWGDETCAIQLAFVDGDHRAVAARIAYRDQVRIISGPWSDNAAAEQAARSAADVWRESYG
ncbi:MAG: hypothetical protein ACRYF9_26085 [Janthinobacterium lividum]